MSNFRELTHDLETIIQNAYADGTTLAESEKFAAHFLSAQIQASTQLAKMDLDARMRKTGLKAVKAAIYMDAATKTEKKPTEAALSATVDMNEVVQSEQTTLDTAEVERDEVERLYNVYREAHIFFRGVAKGKFE